MKIYVTVSGKESLLGGYVVLALAFYNENIPVELTTLLTTLSKTLVGLNIKTQYRKLIKFKDYFFYDYIYLKDYEGLNDYVRWRDSAIKLVLEIKHKLKKPISEVIYSRHIPASTDFPVTVATYINKFPYLYLAHVMAKQERISNIKLLQYKYPNFTLSKHFGSKTTTHFEEIINYGLTPNHHPEALELTAKYIQSSINDYRDEHMLEYVKFFKSLPYWWRIASGYSSLKEYFSETELEQIYKNIALIKKDKSKDIALLSPVRRELPKKFTKWLEENKC